MEIGITHYLMLAAILFVVGVFGIFLNRKNVIIILMSIELMLLSVNINFGKHKGSKWAELPSDYLEWIIERSELDQETKDQARYWLSRRAA